MGNDGADARATALRLTESANRIMAAAAEGFKLGYDPFSFYGGIG